MNLLACLLAACAVPGEPQAPAGEALGRWDEIELPGGARVQSIGVEPGGVLWVLASDGALLYFDGAGLRKVEAPAGSGRFLAPLLGGPDRGLFAARADGSSTEGEVFRLADGRAARVADFYHDVPHRPPGLFVTRAGRLVNWGTRFLAREIDGRWERTEALLDAEAVHVFESGGRTYLYHDRNLYWVDAAGEFGHREIDCPIVTVQGRTRIHGAPWGGDRMFLVENGARKAHAFHLETGDRTPVEEIDRALAKASVHDLVPLADGSLLLNALGDETNAFAFLRVDPRGEVRPVPGAAGLGWRNLRRFLSPGSVRNASDGSIWFATERRGVGRLRGDELRLYGWREGLPDDFRFLAEGDEGEIYAASTESLHVFRPGATAGPAPAWVERWDEVRLAAGEPVRDGEGNVWTFLEDRPGKASRWDGEEWLDVEVPFGTRKVSRAIADDRGHLLVALRSFSDGCYDVTTAGALRFDDLPSMLAAAVADGAREFFPERFLQGVVVDGKRIWFGHQSQRAVQVWEAGRWTTLQAAEPIYHLCESARHGVLLKTQSGAFLRYDRGQLRPLPLPQEQPSRWLIGPAALQPFEEELLDRRPGRYTPVEREADGRTFLLLPEDGAESGSGRRWSRGPALDPRVTMFTSGFLEGHFSRFPREPIVRAFGGTVLACDLRDSPLVGRESYVEFVLEDRRRNLWFALGNEVGERRVFLKRLRGFEARAHDPPATARRELSLEIEALFAGEPQPGARFFWRLRGGPWMGGEPAGRWTIGFPTEGRHAVEIAAMDPAGGVTPDPFRFEVDVTLPRPDTRLLREGPHVAADLIFEIPAEAVATGVGPAPRLMVRPAGGEWKDAYRSRGIPLFGLEPGLHVFEVAAFEDRWGDLSPLRLAVEYAPDYAAILDRRLARMAAASDNREDAQAALLELRMAGPALLPTIEERLEEARRAAEELRVLQALFDAMKVEERRPGR